jgi:[lysine-biosynthesis-protein LysW]--L-2-aminoadipate ligase
MNRLAIVYDRLRWEEKELIKKAEEKAIELVKVDAKEIVLNLNEEKDKIKKLFGDVILQRCISYFRGYNLTLFLEGNGLKVINSKKVAEICGNKLLTTLVLIKENIPTPKTKVAFAPESALRALEEIGYPAVLKPITGSWGRMVSPIKDKDIAETIIEMRERLANPIDRIYYVQEYVKRPPRDVRSIVVGDELVTAVYREAREDEWRTNVARGAVTKPYPVTQEFEELMIKAAKVVGGGVVGVDAMESPDGLVIHEVNNTVEFRGAQSVTKRSIAEAIINYALSLAKR